MFDAIFVPLRNALTVWGVRKADDKIDGQEPGKKILDEAIKKLGEKHGRALVEGPVSNFLREILEGMNSQNPNFVAENTQWAVKIKQK